MKNLLLVILSVLFAGLVSAQNSSGHMTFMGIPIDGSLDDFTVKMEQKGFAHLGTMDGNASFKGEFAGYKDCIIGVVTFRSTGVVSNVAVAFPPGDKWSKIYGSYSFLKEMLTKKYGEPSNSREVVDGEHLSDKDKNRKYDVIQDKCIYESVWETDKGGIELKIIKKWLGSCVVLNYSDKINSAKVAEAALDDL